MAQCLCTKILYPSLYSLMKNLDNLQNSMENNTSENIINSREDLQKFLENSHFTRFGVEKILQSFMAKIPANTRVKIEENTLFVGESVMKIDENMRNFGEKSKALMQTTKMRAMQIIEKKPLTVQPKRDIVAQ